MALSVCLCLGQQAFVKVHEEMGTSEGCVAQVVEVYWILDLSVESCQYHSDKAFTTAHLRAHDKTNEIKVYAGGVTHSNRISWARGMQLSER